jgi:hypothetical protein
MTGLVRRQRDLPEWRTDRHDCMVLTHLVASLLMSESVF